MSGSATLATARLRLATAATRMSVIRTTGARPWRGVGLGSGRSPPVVRCGHGPALYRRCAACRHAQPLQAAAQIGRLRSASTGSTASGTVAFLCDPENVVEIWGYWCVVKWGRGRVAGLETTERLRIGARAGLVRRTRLLESLRTTTDVPVVLVLGGAGFGKTTLVSQWLADDHRSVAWLNASPQHDDPAVLLADIVRVLDEFEPLEPRAKRQLAAVTIDFSSVLVPRLERTIAERARPFVLVIDARAPAPTSCRVGVGAGAGRLRAVWLAARPRVPVRTRPRARPHARRSARTYAVRRQPRDGPWRGTSDAGSVWGVVVRHAGRSPLGTDRGLGGRPLPRRRGARGRRRCGEGSRRVRGRRSPRRRLRARGAPRGRPPADARLPDPGIGARRAGRSDLRCRAGARRLREDAGRGRALAPAAHSARSAWRALPHAPTHAGHDPRRAPTPRARGRAVAPRARRNVVRGVRRRRPLGGASAARRRLGAAGGGDLAASRHC